MSVDSRSRKLYAKQFAVLQKRRASATSRPMTQREIAVLMESRWHNEPRYESADVFLTDEYQRLLKAKLQPVSKDDIEKLLTVKTKNGDAKYRAESFRSSDGSTRTLTEEEARDLLGLEKVIKYRPASEEEAALIYCDVHSRLVKDGLEKEIG